MSHFAKPVGQGGKPVPWEPFARTSASAHPEDRSLAYEMMPGNTADKPTLRDMLALVQKLHGQAERIWPGCPPVEVPLEQPLRDEDVEYLVKHLAEGDYRQAEGRLPVDST